MKKKLLALIFAMSVVLSITACGDEPSPVDGASTEAADTESGTESETEAEEEGFFDADTAFSKYQNVMLNDEESTIAALKEKLDALNDEIGGTYDGYMAQQEAIDAWYADLQTEAKEFYVRLESYNIACYREVPNLTDISDITTTNDNMNIIYDTWNAINDKFYGDLDALSEEAYTIFDEAICSDYENISVEELSSAWSDMYTRYGENWSAMYDTTSAGWSLCYDDHFAVWMGFMDGNTDIDALITESKEQ